MKQATLDLEPPAAQCPLCKGTGMLAEFEIIPDERVCDPIDCPHCMGIGVLGPPPAAQPAQVPFPEPVPAGAVAPASSDEAPDEDAPASTKAPAGPRSKAARIVRLARALGIQSDAEAAGQLGPHPF